MMKKLKYSTVWTLISIGVICNALFSFFLISSSNAGHSFLGLLFGYSLPILSLLLYLQYLAFNKNFPGDRNDRFWALTKPSARLGIIVASFLLLVNIMTLFSPGTYLDFWEALHFFGFLGIFSIVPNLVIQFIFYIYLNKRTAKYLRIK